MNINAFPSAPPAQNKSEEEAQKVTTSVEGISDEEVFDIRKLTIKERRKLSFEELKKENKKLEEAGIEYSELGLELSKYFVPSDFKEEAFNSPEIQKRVAMFMAQLELSKDAFEGAAEKYAQKGDPYKERGMLMKAKTYDLALQMFGIVFDGFSASYEFGLDCAEPFVKLFGSFFAPQGNENTPKVKFDYADGYDQDRTGLQQAA